MAYKVGTLAKVALLNTDEGFEDSAIMSHRLSDAMACSVIKVRDVILPKDTNVYNVLSKGTHIEEGDIMMQYQTPYESEDLQILQRNLAGDEDECQYDPNRPNATAKPKWVEDNQRAPKEGIGWRRDSDEGSGLTLV